MAKHFKPKHFNHLMKIIHISSEAKPYVESGGLADVCEGLPNALSALGHETILILPAFSKIAKKNKWVYEKLMSFEVALSSNLVEDVDVFELKTSGEVRVILIKVADYFDSNNNPGYQEKTDEIEAKGYAFFARACLTWLKLEGEVIELLHCHDWHTGLVPYFLKSTEDHFFKSCKTLFTIHNLAYQGVFTKDLLPDLGLNDKDFNSNGFEYFGKISYLKAGIVFADCVSTVSPTYSDEIQSEAYGMGLDGVLKSKTDGVEGILNGIDNEYWSSMSNPAIVQPFSDETLELKTENKIELQKELGLQLHGDCPMFSFIGRLVLQKGLDILMPVVETLLEKNCQVVFLGLGDKRFHEELKNLKIRFGDRIAVELEFDRNLSQRIYAGSDFFLMPSFFEPCGLSQMISLRYATIPIVRRTGGLADSIVDFVDHPEQGYGVVFNQYEGVALNEACMKALMIYSQKQLLNKCRLKAMEQDFTWNKAAKDYVELYEKVIANQN